VIVGYDIKSEPNTTRCSYSGYDRTTKDLGQAIKDWRLSAICLLNKQIKRQNNITAQTTYSSLTFGIDYGCFAKPIGLRFAFPRRVVDTMRRTAQTNAVHDFFQFIFLHDNWYLQHDGIHNT
jgi:hypothetical protein